MTGLAEGYANAPEPRESNRWLWSAFARSVRDNMMAEFVVQVLRIGGMVILARALSPHDFGLFKILVVVATFAALANEGGIPDALIQRKDLTPAHQWTAWWMSIGLALLTVCILYLGAPGLAGAMKIPELREGTRLLCIPFLLEGAAVSANAQLRRELRFGALATADVLGELAFVVVALFLLWHGMPKWSLAGGLSARYAAHALSLLTVAGKVPRGLPRAREARDLGTFAGKVFGGRMVDALSSNVDFLLIGRLLGSSALGFYAMAWDLLRFVPDRVFKIAGRVTFPAFCALRDQKEQLARAYLNFCGYLSRLVLPVVLCAAIAASELLRAIYGPKWVPAAVPMQLLAFGLLLVGLRLAIGSVYYAKNHPEFDFYIHSTRLVLVVITVCGLASTGLVGVCVGRSAVEVLISIAGQWLACILIGVSLGDLMTALFPGLRLALICGVAAGSGKLLAIHFGVESPLNLIIIAVPPALVYLWLESASAMKMVADAFGRGELTASATAGEA